MWNSPIADNTKSLNGQSQGTTIKARYLLDPVYGTISKGFGPAGLKEAKALLDELG